MKEQKVVGFLFCFLLVQYKNSIPNLDEITAVSGTDHACFFFIRRLRSNQNGWGTRQTRSATIMMDHWCLVIHHSMSRREIASAILTDCGLAAILIEVVRRWSPPPPPHFSVSWSARRGRRVATGRCFGGGCRAPSWRTAGPRRWRPSGPDGAPRRWSPPLPRCCWCCSGSHLLEKKYLYSHTQ